MATTATAGVTAAVLGSLSELLRGGRGGSKPRPREATSTAITPREVGQLLAGTHVEVIGRGSVRAQPARSPPAAAVQWQDDARSETAADGPNSDRSARRAPPAAIARAELAISDAQALLHTAAGERNRVNLLRAEEGCILAQLAVLDASPQSSASGSDANPILLQRLSRMAAGSTSDNTAAPLPEAAMQGVQRDDNVPLRQRLRSYVPGEYGRALNGVPAAAATGSGRRTSSPPSRRSAQLKALRAAEAAMLAMLDELCAGNGSGHQVAAAESASRAVAIDRGGVATAERGGLLDTADDHCC